MSIHEKLTLEEDLNESYRKFSKNPKYSSKNQFTIKKKMKWIDKLNIYDFTIYL